MSEDMRRKMLRDLHLDGVYLTRLWEALDKARTQEDDEDLPIDTAPSE